jgi:hypothetical protein
MVRQVGPASFSLKLHLHFVVAGRAQLLRVVVRQTTPAVAVVVVAVVVTMTRLLPIIAAVVAEPTEVASQLSTTVTQPRALIRITLTSVLKITAMFHHRQSSTAMTAVVADADAVVGEEPMVAEEEAAVVAVNLLLLLDLFPGPVPRYASRIKWCGDSQSFVMAILSI